MASNREVKGSPVDRGIGEEYPYQFTLTDRIPSGTNANASETLYEINPDNDVETDVTATAMTGSPSVSSSAYTTADFVAAQLQDGYRYRLNWGFDIDGDRWDWNLYINASA